jgi:hypothetical protein
MNDLTEDEVKMLRSVRDRGFAVVIFTPEELQNVPARKFQEYLSGYGSETLEFMNKKMKELVTKEGEQVE